MRDPDPQPTNRLVAELVGGLAIPPALLASRLAALMRMLCWSCMSRNSPLRLAILGKLGLTGYDGIRGAATDTGCGTPRRCSARRIGHELEQR